MRFLVDIDNVLIDTTAAVLAQYNEEYNDNLTMSDIKSYWMEQYVKPEAKESFHEIFLKKETWKRAKPIQGNVKAVQWLIDSNHDVFFVTSTWSDNLKKKSNFLKRCFKNIDIEDRLIKSSHKEIITGDVMIDDYARNLNLTLCPEKVCIAYPWNEHYKGQRFSSIAEYIDCTFGNDILLTSKPGQSEK